MRSPPRYLGTFALRGFTLIEVLVALSIVAITLVAGFSAMGALTLHTQRQTDTVLAQLCAENALVAIRLNKQFPGVGTSRSTCLQGGFAWHVDLRVQATPNPNFVRVDAMVGREERIAVKLSTVVGRL